VAEPRDEFLGKRVEGKDVGISAMNEKTFKRKIVVLPAHQHSGRETEEHGVAHQTGLQVNINC